MQKKFTNLGCGHRIWAIASVHGELESLCSIHKKIAADYQIGDRIIYLGNILGIGSEIKATLNEALLFRRALIASPGATCDDIIYLRGAQEEIWSKLLKLQFAPNPSRVLEWAIDQGAGATISAYGADSKEGLRLASKGTVALSRWTAELRKAIDREDGHGEYMSALKHVAYTEDNALLFVNAGIDPRLTLEKQGDVFWWGHSAFNDKRENHTGFSTLVRGYDFSHGGLSIDKHTITLDDGCGFDGTLAAALFDADREPIKIIKA